MDYPELSRTILQLCGGLENLAEIEHCTTRLRVAVHDLKEVDTDSLRALDDVLGLIEKGRELQIVLGPGLAEAVTMELLTAKESGGPPLDWEDRRLLFKRSKPQARGLHAFVLSISKIFTPLIPAIIAAGIFAGSAALIQALGGRHDPVWNFLYFFLDLAGSSLLAYFSIYTGISAARQFGATEYLGGMIGAMTLGPNIVHIAQILGLYNQDAPLKSILTSGKGGIIGVLLAVYCLAFIEKHLRRCFSENLRLIFCPFLSLLLGGFLLIALIMPLAGFLSDGLIFVLGLVLGHSHPLVTIPVGFLLAALFLPLVLLGLHHSLIPLYTLQLASSGGISLFPVLAMAGAGQVGAALALYLLARRRQNKRLCTTIAGALPAAFLGVGEPLLFSVTLPLGKPFITAGLGAGFGGAFVLSRGVLASAWGPSGLTALSMIQAGHSLDYFLGLLISYTMGMIITLIAMREQDLEVFK